MGRSTAERALGEHYFPSSDCPIGVLTLLPAPTGLRHAWDLTGVPHRHDFSELVLVTGGRGTQCVNGVTSPVGSGDVFLLRGTVGHHFPDNRELALRNVLFDPRKLPFPKLLLRRIPGYRRRFEPAPGRLPEAFHLTPRELAEAEQRVLRLDSALRVTGPERAAGAFAALLELIVHLARCDAGDSGDADLRTQLAPVLRLLENRSAEPWTLTELAETAHLSVNHFLRRFKAATGVSPMSYLAVQRLRHAVELLASTNLPIGTVAMRCGFADSNYFARIFRQTTGETPRACRERLRRR